MRNNTHDENVKMLLSGDAWDKTEQAMIQPEPPLLKIGNGSYTHDGKGTICYMIGTCLGSIVRKLQKLTKQRPAGL